MSPTETNGRLWIRLMKKHRVWKSVTVPCTRDDPEDALRRALPALDLAQPMWLPRHYTDWNEYAMTRFMPDHFLEHIPFEYLEISYIYPEDGQRPARQRQPYEDA